jgi:hypothetical protein
VDNRAVGKLIFSTDRLGVSGERATKTTETNTTAEQAASEKPPSPNRRSMAARGNYGGHDTAPSA